jgi:hypothetical protein
VNEARFNWTARHDAALMEGMAQGLTFKEAGKLAGVTKEQACSRFYRLQELMGRQAQ